MARYSVKRAAQRARTEDRAQQKRVNDSFQNFMLGLGIGTGNATSANTYGFNPKTRVRTELEWAYRGSFVAGVAIDVIADDMTREGVDLIGDVQPDEEEQIHERATTLHVWPKLNECIKWGRLYGGAIAVLLIDGQDYSKPLRIDTVGPDQFKGLLVLDRWQVSPSLNDLVTDLGPHLGQPKYYSVEGSAPALRGMKIHYSRCLRLIGDSLPYQQALIENLWGASVLERPFDRMTGFDAATTGASQQVHKSYLRYFKVDKYRDILGGLGGPQAYKGLQEMIAHMRLFASNEGITVIDTKDDMVTTQASNFAGIADVLLQLGQQLSGTFQIPLVRLFGQSPAGLSSTGESDLKTYYDGIKKRQVQDLLVMVTVIYRLIARSLRIKTGPGFGIEFRSLWQMTEGEMADVAAKDTERAKSVHDTGVISDRTFLQELQHTSRRTRRWKSLTKELIEAASDDVEPPEPEMPGPPGMPSPEDGDAGEHAAFALNSPRTTADEEWREEDHPRAENGRFGNGGGSKASRRLSSAEEYAVNHYVEPSDSDTGFLKLNGALRSGSDLSPDQKKQVERLDAALSKLPTFEGRTYRALSFNSEKDLQDFLKSHEEGKSITYPEYLSTSKATVGVKYAKIALVIEGESGADLEGISKDSPEQEVLYPRDTRFTITRVAPGKNGQIMIGMRQSKDVASRAAA
jgi:uncharacterized protein